MSLPINQVLCGNCIEVLKDLPDESIDCVVTDPPYGIGFVGKDWDMALPPKQAFSEMFRVLKSGALAFVMSSPRQDVLWHMLKMLEECGFEMRQSFVSWIYKCVDEATEILTIEGWKGIDSLEKGELVCTFNIEKEQLEYQKCNAVFRYEHEGDMVHVQNQDTDQLLTLTHRVLHKDRKHSGNKYWNGKWEFTEVHSLTAHQGMNLPLAYPYNSSKVSIGEDFAELLGWVLGEGWEQKESNGINISQTETNLANVIRIRRLLERLNFTYSEYEREREYEGEPYIEHQFHIHAKHGKKIRKRIPKGEPTLELLHLPYNERQALFEALIRGEGSGKLGSNLVFYQKSTRFREWFQLLCLHQGYRTSTNSDKKQYVSVSPRHTTQLQHRHLNPIHEDCRVHRVPYTGRVWCVETSNGTFVARRNRKIFITGNSGFPKAYDISKGIDKRNARQREKYQEFADFLRNRRIKLKLAQKDIATYFPSKTGGLTGCVANWELGYNIPTKEQWQTLKKLLNIQTSRFNELINRVEAEREVIGKDGRTAKQSMFNLGIQESWDLTNPSSDEAKKWQGWKSITGLKPALECILMVNKPMSEKTIVDNVLRRGVGGINVDACRIPFQSEVDKEKSKHNWKPNSSYPIDNTVYEYGSKVLNTHQTQKGRFPANLLVSDGALDTGKITKSHINSPKGLKQNKGGCFGGGLLTANNMYPDVGDQSRYFSLDAWAEHYGFLDVPKASKSERDRGLKNLPIKTKPSHMRTKNGTGERSVETGFPERKCRNIHPTVKPVKLMAYLIELGCPPEGIVLDPFAGSGSTLIAAHKLGRQWIGIEIRKDYVEIAQHRLTALDQKLTSFLG